MFGKLCRRGRRKVLRGKEIENTRETVSFRHRTELHIISQRLWSHEQYLNKFDPVRVSEVRGESRHDFPSLTKELSPVGNCFGRFFFCLILLFEHFYFILVVLCMYIVTLCFYWVCVCLCIWLKTFFKIWFVCFYLLDSFLKRE